MTTMDGGQNGPCRCGGAKCSLRERDARHATTNGYNHLGCRCDECREANRVWFSLGHPGWETLKRYRDKLTARGIQRAGPAAGRLKGHGRR